MPNFISQKNIKHCILVIKKIQRINYECLKFILFERIIIFNSQLK